jgi:Bacterial PH domain/Short C-terminal domain
MAETGPNASGTPDALRSFLNEEQDPAVVQTVHARVQEILTSGEKVLYVAVQKKPLLNMAPDCVVLTNKRFIAYRPKILGRVSFEDYPWRELHDARLQENLLGATLAMRTVSGRMISVDYIPKAQGRRLYALAQEMEERVREERRARELEDKRAAAGGVVVTSAPGPGPTATQQPNPLTDPVQRLKSLKDMLDAGLISSSEYEAKRAEIIAKM